MHCECGNPIEAQSTLCLECEELLGKREFVIGQQVRIIRRETWQGEICTITRRSEQNPNMYWLREHGWRRSDEIQAFEEEPLQEEREQVKELLSQALSIDGAHHKQWYLWRIAEALSIELPDDIADKGIAP